MSVAAAGGVFHQPGITGVEIAGDFGGDGNAGLVWQNTSTGERGIWFMKNGGLTSSINLPMVPLTWSIVDH